MESSWTRSKGVVCLERNGEWRLRSAGLAIQNAMFPALLYLNVTTIHYIV